MKHPRSHAALAVLALLLPAACAQSPSRPQAQLAAAPGAAAPGNVQGAVPGAMAVAEAAPPPPVPSGTPGDPLESFNRAMFDVNLALDDAILRPVALGYRHVFPAWVRDRFRNVVSNAQELRYSANALLQGEPVAAGTSLMRFVINTTIGLGGMFDMQSIGGPPLRRYDFGQTLYRWGIGDGPFLMVPVVGPTNARDMVGRVADGFMNPVSWAMPIAGNFARGAVEGVDLRERNIENLDALRADSLDFYARIRSIWQQQRDAELGRSRSDPSGLDILEDPDAPAPVGAPQSAVETPPGPRVATAAPVRRPARVAARPSRPRAAAVAARRAPARPAGPVRTAALPRAGTETR